MADLNKLLKLHAQLKRFANGGIIDADVAPIDTSILGYKSVDDEYKKLLESAYSEPAPIIEQPKVVNNPVKPIDMEKEISDLDNEDDKFIDSEISRLDKVQATQPKNVEQAPITPLKQDRWEKLLSDWEASKSDRDARLKSAQDRDALISISNDLARAFETKGGPEGNNLARETAAQDRQLGDIMNEAKIQNLLADKKNPFVIMNAGKNLVRINKSTGEAEYISPSGQPLPADPDDKLLQALKIQALQGKIANTEDIMKNRAFNQGEKNQPKEATKKVFAESTNLLNKLDKAIATFDPNAVGPVKGRMNSALTTMYGLDPKSASYQSNIGMIMADYIKSISGAAVSDQERATLTKLIPNTAMTPEVFKSVLKSFRDNTLSTLNTSIEAANLGGDDVSKYRDEYNKARDFNSGAAESKIDAIIKANTKDGKAPTRSQVIDELKKAGKIPSYYQ